MSVELTIETVEETIVLELQDRMPAVLAIDNIPELRDELDSKVDKEVGRSLVSDTEIEKLSTVEQYAQENTVNSVAGKQGDVLLDKEDVGLSAVDNTADADKPVSTAVAAALANKVDKVEGKQLSTEDFTSALKDKLTGLEGTHWRGTFVSLPALEAGVTDPAAGDYADVDAVGADVERYIWDATDGIWVVQSGAVAPITASQVKQLYESNPDTNAFTDADEEKLGDVQPWAYASTVNKALGDLGFQPFSISMVQAETESEAQDALGMSTVGKAVATASSESEARNAMGLPLATVEQMKALVDTTPVAISPHLLRLAIHFSSDTSTLIYNHSSNTYDTSLLRTTSIHKAMRRCLVSDDGTINYYLDPYDSTKKEDGTVADLSGADGQVMVELKAFYCSRKVEGSIETISLSSTMQPGMVLHPAFFVDGKPISKILLGAYQATVMDGTTVIPGLNLDDNRSRVSLSTGKLCSLSGGDHYAMVGLDLSEFRTLAKNRGPGWDEWDFMTWQAAQFLLYTQEGTFNGQQAIGDGNVHKSYPAGSNVQSDSPHTVNGVSNALGNQSGSMTGVNAFVSFNGLEHLWGNAWQWLDGVLINDTIVHVCDDPSLYSSTLTENYLPIGSSIGANPSGSYILSCQDLDVPVFLNGSGVGNSSRYMGDAVWHNTGLRGARVGGGSDYGARGGPAALSANHAPAHRLRYIGGRVMFKKLTRP